MRLHLELFDCLTAGSQKIICSTETRSTGLQGNAEVRLFRISVSGFLSSVWLLVDYKKTFRPFHFSDFGNGVAEPDGFNFFVERFEFAEGDFCP